MTEILSKSDAELVAQRRNFVLARLLPILAGIAIGFAIVDRIVAATDTVAEEGAFRYGDPLLGWDNRPGFENPQFETKLDRFGFRNEEIPDDADPKEIRIAGFGASRLYGAGNEIVQPKCWNYVLEDLLRRDDAPSVRVLNGGVMAYSASQAALRAKLYLDAVEPDLVFVTVSATMQFLLDDKEARRFVEIDGEPVPKSIADAWPRALVPAVMAFKEFAGRNSAIVARHNNREMMEGDLPPGVQSWLYFDEPEDPAMRRALRTTWDNFLELRRACDERGVELRIAVVPTTELLRPVAWQAWLEENGARWGVPRSASRRAPIDHLIQRLRELGFEVWDLSPETNRIGREFRRFMSADNGHWNVAGHALIAEGLARCLAEEDALPRLAAERAAHPRPRPYGELPR